MAKPKVLILGKLPPPYFGPAIATDIILNSSLQSEFELYHFNTRINDTIDTIGEKSIGKFILVLKKYYIYRKLIKKFKPDLILVPISQSTIGFIKDSLYLNFGNKSGGKVLLQLRGSNLLNWLNKSTMLTRWYFRYSLKKTSGAIVLGENLRYLFNDFFPREKIHVVPNGGNFLFQNANKKQDEFKILYFSNLLQSKGIEDVIDTALILKQRNITSISFLLAGAWLDVKLKSKCLNRIKSQDLPVQVFPQSSGDLKKKFFCEADVFLFPPREPEGHPWVIIEAMAAGLPIITTDQGAIIESVQNGKNGFIVNINQPEEIADKIEFLQLNHKILEEMGRESRLLYEQKFTEEIMIKNLKIAFEKTLASQS